MWDVSNDDVAAGEDPGQSESDKYVWLQIGGAEVFRNGEGEGEGEGESARPVAINASTYSTFSPCPYNAINAEAV